MVQNQQNLEKQAKNTLDQNTPPGLPREQFDIGKKIDDVIEGAKHFNRNRKIVLAGAIIGFIAAFLPWWSFKYTVFGYPIPRGTWHGLHSGGVAAFIMVLLVFVVLFLPYFSKKRQSVKNDTIIYLCLGIIGTISILATFGTYSSAITYGIFVALAGQILILAGGYLEFKRTKSNQIIKPETKEIKK